MCEGFKRDIGLEQQDRNRIAQQPPTSNVDKEHMTKKKKARNGRTGESRLQKGGQAKAGSRKGG